VLLNREETAEFFGDKTDDQIAKVLFRTIPEIASVQADAVPPLTLRSGLLRRRQQ